MENNEDFDRGGYLGCGFSIVVPWIIAIVSAVVYNWISGGALW
jgi:hypothetical protein